VAHVQIVTVSRHISHAFTALYAVLQIQLLMLCSTFVVFALQRKIHSIYAAGADSVLGCVCLSVCE